MNKRFTKILITGGGGYIGTALTQELLQKGYQVRVLDSLRFGGAGLIPFFSNKNFEFIKGDVRNSEDIIRSLKGVDAIIHLAAIVGFPACRKDPQLSYDITVNGTKNLVSHVKGKIPILFASTSSVYGKITDKICTEETKLHPLSEYGIHKAEAEKIIKKNKTFVIFRFATAFGVSPRMRLDLMPNDFVYRAVKEKSLIVYEKKFMRTFIHVRDMARSFLFALENYQKMKGEVYNVGDNKMNYSKEDVCLLIKEKVNYYLHFAEIDKDLEQRDYKVSYDKLAKVGFHTKLTMEEGIEELVKVAQVLDVQDQYRNI
jgi:nucleoside-diphosphate-sugar epimerase